MDKQTPPKIRSEHPAARYDSAPAPSWDQQAAERQQQGFPTFRANFDEPEGRRR